MKLTTLIGRSSGTPLSVGFTLRSDANRVHWGSRISRSVSLRELLAVGISTLFMSGVVGAATWPSGIINPLTGRTGGSVSLVANGGFLDPGYARDENRQHVGTDLASPTGGTDPVYAIADGTVSYVRRYTDATYNSSCIVVEHVIGGERLLLVYGHVYAGSGINEGSTVRAGSPIGTLRRFNSYHLHLGVNVSTTVGGFMIDANHGWGRVPVATTSSRVAQLGWRDPIPYLRALPTTSGGGSSVADAEGNTRGSAKPLTLNATTPATIAVGDIDYFTFNVTTSGELDIRSVGDLDLMGSLEDSSGRSLVEDDDSGSGNNFQIRRSVSPGRYYLRVTGFRDRQVGGYGLEAGFRTSSTGGSGSSGSGSSSSRGAKIVLMNGSSAVPSGSLLLLQSATINRATRLDLRLRNVGSGTASISGVSLTSRDLRPRSSAPTSIRSGSTATLSLDLVPGQRGQQTWGVRASLSNGEPFTVWFRADVR